MRDKNRRMHKKNSTIIFFIMPVLLLTAPVSCSLKYDEVTDTTDSVPEFVFRNARYSRYENSKKSIYLSAGLLEQYKKDSASYARNAVFSTWDKNGTLDTEGKCYLLGINLNEEIYTLFNDILIKNTSQNFKIRAENLRWNGKTEQLTAGADETVYITKDDVELSGKGFSASGVNRNYRFSSSVNGTMTTKDEPSSEQIQAAEE